LGSFARTPRTLLEGTFGGNNEVYAEACFTRRKGASNADADEVLLGVRTGVAGGKISKVSCLFVADGGNNEVYTGGEG
jgi:hypothetical protein